MVKPARVEPDDSPRPLGMFDVTFYYVIGEDEVGPKRAKRPANGNAVVNDGPDPSARPAANDNGAELAAMIPAQDATSGDLITLYEGKACEPIADVSREFASQLSLQGTGKLKDGRVLNIWGACPCPRSPCFKVMTNQWGTAGSGRSLLPFRTVAVDRKVIKLGTLLYVPLLEGKTMPGRAPWGGFVHDGCVVADDTGGAIDGHQLDLFVGRKAYFFALSGHGGSHSWARGIPVYDGSKICERKGRRVARKAGAI